MNDYTANAVKTANKYNIKLTIKSSRYGKHFASDTQSRYIFRCRLYSPQGSYTFDFGQSITAGSEEPNMYDILACLQKYDCDSFSNFCDDFGYEQYEEDTGRENRESYAIYTKASNEYDGVCRLFENGIVPDDVLEIC